MFPAYVNPIGAGIVSSSSIFVVGATVVGATVVAFSVGATVAVSYTHLLNLPQALYVLFLLRLCTFLM